MEWYSIYGDQISSSHIPFNGCFRKSCWSAVTALNLSEKSVVPSPGWIAMLYYDARHPALKVTLLTQDGINGYQLTMREPDNMKDADKVISQQASCTEYCPCSCHCRLQILGAVLLLSVMKDVCVAEIDLGYLNKVRQQMPLMNHRRTDIYGSLNSGPKL